MVGTQLQSEAQHGKYRLLLRLGEGGTANVYLAVARGPSGFNKLVVLKLLRSNLAEDREFRRMFLNEARLAARLNHQNIVQTYEVYEMSGIPVIVMEYLEGQSLSAIATRLQDSEPSFLRVQLKIISEVLSGLEYSHELADYDGKPLNLVHRDITPHNVLVSFDGQVKILDFGIAKLSGSNVETKAGVIKGKVRYMSPEQLAGDVIDRRTDLFSVGIMLWEVLTGHRMWKTMSEFEISAALTLGEIPAPSTVRLDINPELERICIKALAADRNERYRTALDFQTDLEQALHSLGPPVSAREIGQLVASLFKELREETRRVIEQELSNANSAAAQQEDDEHNWAAREASLRSIERASYTTVSSDERTRTMSTTIQRKSRRLRFGLGVAAIVGVGLIFALFARNTEQSSAPRTGAPPSSPASAPPATPISLPVARPPSTPEKINLRISVIPAEAKLFLDDKPLAGNPFFAPVETDRTKHTIRAEAHGYMQETRAITLDKDLDITLRLQPVATAVKRSDASKTPPEQPKPGPDCSRNYFVDEQGIKRFKLECM